MQWSWSARKRELQNLRKETEKLRERIARLTAQRDKARDQRDRARLSLPPPDAGNVPADWHDRLHHALAERQLYLVLHQNVIGDLEFAEAHPLPPQLEWPLPPHELRFRIGGQRSGSRFLEIGRTVADDLARLAHQAGRDPAGFESVLDFGCGCGRVSRFLPGVFPNAAIHGADIDPEAVGWCRQNLGFMRDLHVLPLHPPSPLPDGAYDFIFAISVFTHLPLEVQRAWLAELRRAARPGALVVLTYMPESDAALHFKPDMALENDNGFSYYKTSNTPGLPDYYQVSYHTEAAARRLFGEHFEVQSLHPRGVNTHQHVAVCTVPR